MLHVFSVYDSVAQAHLQPFYGKSTNDGIRMFAAAVNDSNHQFAKYSGDYGLFELGKWDERTSKFELHKQPVNLGLAQDFRHDRNVRDDTELSQLDIEDSIRKIRK